MSKVLFQVICPKGYTIGLDRDCWHGHILSKRYLRMRNHRDDIQATIEKPDLIYQNEKHGRINNLYWKHFPQLKFPDKWLKVATWIVGVKEKKGIVTTAHFAVIPGGGQLLWKN